MAGLIVDGLGHPLHLGDVPERDEEAVGLVLLLVDPRYRAVDEKGLPEGVLDHRLVEEEGLLVQVGGQAREQSAMGPLVQDREDARDVAALGGGLRPTGNAFRHLVHESDGHLGIGGDDAVVDRVQDGGEESLLLAKLPVDAVLVERDVDGRVELAFLEGLENIAGRLDFLRPLEGFLVGVGRQENDRYGELRADLLCRLDAVHAPREHDVHEDDIRQPILREGDSLGAVAGHAYDGIAEALETTLKIKSDDLFVFDD